MAKYETTLTGDFDGLLDKIDSAILSGSASATCEDASDYQSNGVRCAVRVYERYSMMGGNRLSMNITLIGHENNLFVSAITAGGSQAVFFKINTFGEESFLQHAIRVIEKCKNA